MKYILCVAEKPDAAKAFAQALSPSFDKKIGYLEGSNNIIYTWAVGHLLELVEPGEIDEKFKLWRKEDLPIIPNHIPLKVIPGKEQQLRIIQNLAKQASVIYNCCDSAIEGQAIFSRIYTHLRLNNPVKRIWTSSLQPKAVLQAFDKAKDDREYAALSQAGILRAETDWLIGMNASRAATLAVNNGVVLRVGRVLLPVLSIIYDREKERKEFKKTTYHVLTGVFKQNGIVYEGERLIEDGYPINRTEVEMVQKMIQSNPSEIKILEKEKKTFHAPKLFDLTELSRVANKRFGYKASHTLSILQELYLKKLVTYPRTSSQYVGESEISLMHDSFDVLASAFPQFSKGADKKYVHSQNKRICDDSKIEDHHAVLPEPVKVPNDLTNEQIHIYELVVERFFLQFYAEAIYEHLKVGTVCKNELFISYFRSPLQLGWQETISNNEQDEDELSKIAPVKALPALNFGPVECINSKIEEKETAPPPAFTDGTLIQLMKNISRRVTDPKLKESLAGKGIGTAATRGEIIQKLEKYEYTKYKNKSIEITKLGNSLVELFRSTQINTLTSPEFTALWEYRLEEIKKGIRTKDDFENKMKDFCRVIVNELGAIAINQQNFETEGIGICPKCSGKLKASETRFYCTNHKNGCEFFIWKKQFGKVLTTANLKQLLEKKITNTLTFTKKDKEKGKYKGKLKLEDNFVNGNLKMEFVNSK